MSEVDEPQFTSLSARIAALKQQQNRDSNGASVTGNKPQPPPRPVSETQRPQIDFRSKTIANPPMRTFRSSVARQVNNQPGSAKTIDILPPPPIDRDIAKVPPALPNRKGPPPLPARKASQPSPNLPPRRPSGQLSVRRGSNDSLVSQNSTISSLSMRTMGSTASSVDTCTGRKLPPALDQAILPPLPPTRRELEDKTRQERETRASLVSVKSAPAVAQIEWNMPTSSGLAPRLPLRPNKSMQASDSPTVVPNTRKLPPIVAPAMPPRPVYNKQADHQSITDNKPPPIPYASRPSQKQLEARGAIEAGPAVVVLNPYNFDSIVIRSGKPALVDFYAPYCRYCKELDPIFEELAAKFAAAGGEVTIAKMDVDAYKSFATRYNIQSYPTLKWFDGMSDSPEPYDRMRDSEAFTAFIALKTGKSSMGRSVIPKPARAPIDSCLLCRDFSAPDNIAAQYPRQSNIDNSTEYLARVLCAPFDSLTDKARAIFTWCHHNLDYDTEAFFGNNLQWSTPENTIAKGLAVCSGYARVYEAIALKAGLECVMVTGHGKGYGFTQQKAGAHIGPPDLAGHAWNAVRIDNGQWKLIDACWGAGYVINQQYTRKFKPSMFTMSNEEFGEKHFPAEAAYFFRSDGRHPTWEEYIIGKGEVPQIYDIGDENGINSTSFLPSLKAISVNSPGTTRFRFSKTCLHWDHIKNGVGAPYCMLLRVNGLDGKAEDFVPFDYDGTYWWTDVVTKQLGTAGQKVTVMSLTTVNGKDARGMTKKDYLAVKGKPWSMAFGAVASWDLV